MFIILSYITGTYDNLNIVSKDGEPIFFGSKFSAERYAKKECAFDYVIVKI